MQDDSRREVEMFGMAYHLGAHCSCDDKPL